MASVLQGQFLRGRAQASALTSPCARQIQSRNHLQLAMRRASAPVNISRARRCSCVSSRVWMQLSVGRLAGSYRTSPGAADGWRIPAGSGGIPPRSNKKPPSPSVRRTGINWRKNEFPQNGLGRIHTAGLTRQAQQQVLTHTDRPAGPVAGRRRKPAARSIPGGHAELKPREPSTPRAQSSRISGALHAEIRVRTELQLQATDKRAYLPPRARSEQTAGDSNAGAAWPRRRRTTAPASTVNARAVSRWRRCSACSASRACTSCGSNVTSAGAADDSRRSREAEEHAASGVPATGAHRRRRAWSRRRTSRSSSTRANRGRAARDRKRSSRATAAVEAPPAHARAHAPRPRPRPAHTHTFHSRARLGPACSARARRWTSRRGSRARRRARRPRRSTRR